MTLRRRAAALAAVAALAAALAGCGPQRADWGFAAIRGMATPADPPLACGAAFPADPTAAARAACAFRAGDRAADTLGIDRATLDAIPVRHVVVVMKENRSFDHLLGRLHDEGQPGVEAIPASYQNPDLRGDAVFPFPATTTCDAHDPPHQSGDVTAQLDHGRMDGFVRAAAGATGTDGRFVMGVHGGSDLPFYTWLAATFAVADRHFAPIATGTYANRDYLLFGSNVGVVDTGTLYPPPTTPSILQLLMSAGFTWGVYTDGKPLSGALGWRRGDPGVHSLQALYDALDAGTLPSVAFVDGKDGVEDDHPMADLQRGEAWLRTLFDHAVLSPQWPRLAIVWTYDEGGGFADHVDPQPPGCPASADSSSTRRGPRVPLVVISPWARRGFASHLPQDHTSITRLVEALFDLPALTARDANADALLDLFDFSCGRDLSVPPAPAAGTGGCVR
jgi:phospholipase C